MKLSELRGKPVVSVAEAVKLGVVEDALVDPTLGRIGALEIGASGQRERYLVSMDQVRAIGPDVVTVSGQHALLGSSQTSDTTSRIALTSIVGNRVVSENGRVLGTVLGVEFDPGTGRVEAIEYGGEGLEALLGSRHLLEPSHVIGVGPKVLTVKDLASQSSPNERAA